MYTNHDTICAVATATGSAIAVIRVSGCQALEITGSIFSKDLSKAKAYTMHYGEIIDSGNVVDEVLLSIFHAPHSYTGEDSVEISCHGSRYIVQQILNLLIANGCRMADPGEYTMRAYLNGKMDLSQAEAVADLIASTNRTTHQLAISQLRGGISHELSTLRDQLLKLTSLLELELDFSDHEELEFADRTELLELARHIDSRIRQLAHSFDAGQAIKQGIPVAIVGKTNVGKSTLLNRLLKDDRAIVSDIHGTTRDTIEDAIDIQGITFRFIDTAGIRLTTDAVEQIGISRTYQAIEKARIVLWLIDEIPTQAETDDMLNRCEGKKLIVVRNKTDKYQDTDSPDRDIPLAIGSAVSPAFIQDRNTPLAISSAVSPAFIQISAKFDKDLNALETAIHAAADVPELKESDIIITSARHYDALTRAHGDILRVIDGITLNLSGDLIAEDLRQVLSHLAEITGGEITTDETLGNIFKHFCVGK